MTRLVRLLFFIPLVFSVLNIQAFLAKFSGASEAIVQAFAYLNVIIVLCGGILWFRYREKFAPGIYLWFFFYLIYYFFALIANLAHETEPYRLLPSFIPLIYLWAFSVFLSNETSQKKVRKLLMVTFVISSILTILFYYFNFSLDLDGVYEYGLNRSGGVYGDANNACLSAILGLILVKYYFNPISPRDRLLKTAAILISVFAILLTFSKTGFLVLILVLAIIYRKWFNVKRFLYSAIAIPSLLVILYSTAVSKGWLNSVQLERVDDIINVLTFNYSEINLSERDVLLRNMLGYIEENPVLGNGVQFGVSIRGHNTIIGVWADAGIFAFLAFLSLLAYYLMGSLRIEGKYRFMVFCLLLSMYVYMLSLQTIINQPYLVVVFVFCAYELRKGQPTSENTSGKTHMPERQIQLNP